jgi:hypothetical protein
MLWGYLGMFITFPSHIIKMLLNLTVGLYIISCVGYLLKASQCFGFWVCFCHQVKAGRRGAYSGGSLRQS